MHLLLKKEKEEKESRPHTPESPGCRTSQDRVRDVGFSLAELGALGGGPRMARAEARTSPRECLAIPEKS